MVKPWQSFRHPSEPTSALQRRPDIVRFAAARLIPEHAVSAPCCRRDLFAERRRNRMSRKPESLRDLIESRAAQDGIAPRQLCRWAFEAIIQNTLLLTFPKDVSPDTEWENPTDLRHAIGRLLQDFEHVDPFKFGWVGNLKCNPKEF